MKKVILLSICIFCISFHTNAQSYNVIEQFISHRLVIVDAQTRLPIQTFDDYKGVVVSARINNQEYLCIKLVDEIAFNITVVNKAEEVFDGNLKIRMYQGGENIEGVGTYTANVFFSYDLSKNAKIPENIRLELNGSPYIYDLSGIIKIQ